MVVPKLRNGRSAAWRRCVGSDHNRAAGADLSWAKSTSARTASARVPISMRVHPGALPPGALWRRFHLAS